MRLTLLLVALLLLGAQAPAPNAVVAEAGDIKLTTADVAALLAASNPDLRAKMASDPAVLDRVIRAQLVQMLVLQEAQAKQWDTKPNIEFLARQAHNSAIASSYLASLATPPADYPSDAEIQATYDAQKDHLMLPRQFHVAQIFVAVPTNAAPAVDADAKKRIAALRQAVAKPHADFAAIAKKESDDKNSAPSGGDLGWLAEDRIRPPVRDVVVGMQTGAISEPLRTDDGWHIVTLLGVKPPAQATLSDVRGQIVQAMRQQRTTALERQAIDELVKRQPIRLDEIALQKAAQQ